MKNSIIIRKLTSDAVSWFIEIDRSEHITHDYTVERGKLKLLKVNWRVPRWDQAEMQKKLDEWAPITEGYENMWGAFDKELLVGFAVYRKNLTEEMAQYALLHISNGYRRIGIGKALSEQVFRKARSDAKKQIYVTAAPTEATVSFYKTLGFKVAQQLNQELYRLEPDDIHMIMKLWMTCSPLGK